MVWSREERSFAAGLAILALIGAGWWAAGRMAAGGTAVEPLTAAESDPEPPPAPSPEPAPEAAGELIVHVAGAVAAPGVYRLPPDARAVDALDAAGGPVGDAAVDAVNLAAPVVDGTRLYIPTHAEVEGLAAGGGEGWPPSSGVGSPAAGTGFGAVAVNRASPAELERLPGIGPVLAGRIVEHRRQHGPFRTVEDLLEVSGIGPAVLERIRPHVIVP